ncbi:unnamed protein product, partial [Prorocentrum cordatum]
GAAQIPTAGPVCTLDGELALITANASQWSSAQTLMEWMRHDTSDVGLPQVLCVQEHRIKNQGLWSSAVRWSRQRGYELIGDFAEVTGDGPLESSGGVAVLSSLPAVKESSPARLQLPGHRVVTAKVNIGLPIPLYVISLYLVTSIGLAKDNIAILASLLSFLGGLDGPW